jgi:2-oxoglutarate ferredoxin oxidoreductase subunit alpha
MDVAEAVELTQLAFHLAATWRNPVLVFGDYYLAHTTGSVDVERCEFGPLPPVDWALDGSSGGSGRAKIVSPLGEHKRSDGEGYNLADHYRACAEATAAMIAGVEPLVDTGFTDGAEVVAVAFGTPGRYVRAAVRAMRADGLPVGYVRPISLFPFPSAALAEACGGARAIAVYENNQGQMIDDVRLAVLGRTPVRFIGGLSLDSSGFGIAPDLDVRVIRSRLEHVLRDPDGGGDAQ